MTWYERPLRIAALQCNYEGGRNLAVIGRWKAMGFNAEQLFHPMADGYSALFDRERHGELLGRYLAGSRRAGLRVILYLNVHILGPSQAVMRDRWAQRDREGGWPLLYDTYHPCCITGPWREHFLGVLDSLAGLDIDGVFLDGPALASGACFCDACREAYRRRGRGPLEAATEEDRRSFHAGERSSFLRLSYARLKAVKPEALFYINLPVTNPHASLVWLPDALAYNDILGTEGGFQFYGPARDAFLWKPGVRARILESLAPDKPRVIFMAADHKPWSWYPHTPVETRLCIASSVANGASIWWGLHGSTRLLSTPGARAAGALLRFLARHEEHYRRTVSAARIAVLYSYDTEREYGAAVGRSDFYGSDEAAKPSAGDFNRSFAGLFDALARSCLPTDVMTDIDLSAERLGRYDCLLLPTCSCLSDRLAAAIEAWVQRGGNLVASFDSSLYDERGTTRPDFALGRVLGVSFAGAVTAYRDFNYFAFSRGAPHLAARLASGIDTPLVPAPSFAVEVRALPDASVLARFHAPMAGRYVDLTPPASPAIVAHRHGKGTALYLAGSFGEMLESFRLPEHRLLIRNAARALSRSEVELVTLDGGSEPLDVEVCVRRSLDGPGRVVHLVNHAGFPHRPFERVARQEGLGLRASGRLGVQAARALAVGRRLRLSTDGAATVVRLPPVADYEVVVLETKR